MNYILNVLYPYFSFIVCEYTYDSQLSRLISINLNDQTYSEASRLNSNFYMPRKVKNVFIDNSKH